MEFIVRLHPRNESGFTEEEEGRYERHLKGSIDNAFFADVPVQNWDVIRVGPGTPIPFHRERVIDLPEEAVRESDSPNPKEPIVLMARSTDATGDFWRCWHVAKAYPDGSLKALCGVWLLYKGQSAYTGRRTETADLEGFSFAPRQKGEICRRMGCADAIRKL